MELKLPPSVLEGLPAPDENGVVRVTVGLRMKAGEKGKARIVEINDTPVGPKLSEEDEQSESLTEAVSTMPPPGDVAAQILGGA